MTKQIIKKMAIMSKENKNGNKNNSIDIEFKKMLVKEIDNVIFKSLFTYENVDYEEILKIKCFEKIPEAKLKKAEASKNPTTARRARLAETLRGLSKGKK